MLATGAIVLPLGFVVALSGAASAARSHPTGTGLVKCNKIKGTITFNPPLQTSGTASSETTTTSATASACSGGTPNPSKVISTSSSTTTGTDVNTCGSLATATAPTISGVYDPNTIAPSSTSGGTLGLVSSPKVGFTITNATTTGSFPSTTTDIAVSSKDTLTKFDAACAKPAGVATLKIVKGNVQNL